MILLLVTLLSIATLVYLIGSMLGSFPPPKWVRKD